MWAHGKGGKRMSDTKQTRIPPRRGKPHIIKQISASEILPRKTTKRFVLLRQSETKERESTFFPPINKFRGDVEEHGVSKILIIIIRSEKTSLRHLSLRIMKVSEAK